MVLWCIGVMTTAVPNEISGDTQKTHKDFSHKHSRPSLKKTFLSHYKI